MTLSCFSQISQIGFCKLLAAFCIVELALEHGELLITAKGDAEEAKKFPFLREQQKASRWKVPIKKSFTARSVKMNVA